MESDITKSLGDAPSPLPCKVTSSREWHSSYSQVPPTLRNWGLYGAHTTQNGNPGASLGVSLPQLERRNVLKIALKPKVLREII